MDFVSIVIIVTVLSLSSALIYLFKSDFERRKRSYFAATNNSQPTITQHTNSASNGSNQKKQAKKQVHQTSVRTQANQSKQAPASSNSTEPLQGELDESVLLGVFNPKLAKANQEPQQQQQQQQNQETSMSKKALRKLRQSVDKSPTSYSSEQLFRIIAATNLSREEIELAVETLLNKIELGDAPASDSAWRQPKNDPLQRLKSQLRDSEAALASETQNHEQTRVKLFELRGQLQVERSAANGAKEELAKSKKEFALALEQARADLTRQQMIQKQLREDNAQLANKFDQNGTQLQSLMATIAAKDADCLNYRKELEEKVKQLRNFELSSQNLQETICDLKTKLRSAEIQLDQLNASKQHEEYEACAKISELEADKSRLEKLLKDRLNRINEISESNNLLEKSLKELQLMNNRQEDLLARLRDERHVGEACMKRTLFEMDQELKKLQSELSLSSNESAFQNDHTNKSSPSPLASDELLAEKASERERKLATELNQLREGLAALLPKGSLKPPVELSRMCGPNDWVQQCLTAVRQLSEAVDELRSTSSNNRSLESSPTHHSASGKKSTINGSGSPSRVGSPNGRPSSRNSPDERKKLMEGKLLELNCYPEEQEEDEELNSSQSSLLTTDSEESHQNEHQFLRINKLTSGERAKG